jgi:hypothetical protein
VIPNPGVREARAAQRALEARQALPIGHGTAESRPRWTPAEPPPEPPNRLVRAVEIPAPRHGVKRAEAGPLLLLGIVNELHTVEDSAAGLALSLGVSARTARTWRTAALTERDPEGRPLIVARDGYLIRGAGFDAWLDARTAENVGRLRTVSLPFVTLRHRGASPVARLAAALIRTEALGTARRFLPSDARRAAELGVDRATITKARDLLTATRASTFTAETVQVSRGIRATRYRQTLAKPNAVLISAKVTRRRAQRAQRLRDQPQLHTRGNQPAAARGKEPAGTRHREPSVLVTPSKAEPVAMAPSFAPQRDGFDLRGLVSRFRTDRTQRDERTRRTDEQIRTSLADGTAETLLANEAARFSRLHGAERIAQQRHAMERTLLALGVEDLSQSRRRTLSHLLVSRGADPVDLLPAARRAFGEKGTKAPRALLASRLRSFATTGDRSWLSQGKVQSSDRSDELSAKQGTRRDASRAVHRLRPSPLAADVRGSTSTAPLGAGGAGSSCSGDTPHTFGDLLAAFGIPSELCR